MPFSPGLACVVGDALWLGQEAGPFLTRVEGPSLEQTALVELPGELVAEAGVVISPPITAMSAAEGSLWVLSPVAGLVHLDAATGHIRGVAPVSGGALAADADGVWVVGGGGALRRADISDCVVREVAELGGDLRDVAIAFGSVWLGDNASGETVRFDSAAGHVVARVPVLTRSAPPRIAINLGGSALGHGTGAATVPGFASDERELWVGSVLWPAADAIDHRFGHVELVRMDPGSNERTLSVRPDFVTSAFDVGDGLVLAIGRSHYRDREYWSPVVTFDAASGEPVASTDVRGRGFRCLMRCGDGRWLTAGSGGIIQIVVRPLRVDELAWERPEVPRRQWSVARREEPSEPPAEPQAFEEWQRRNLERATVRTRRPGSHASGPGLAPIHDGRTNRPVGLIPNPSGRGIVFEQVRLSGSLPDTQIEVIFGGPGRDSCRYGWRSSLWNSAACRERSQPVSREYLDYLDVYLQEDIGTRLPAACDPDEQGITWIDLQPVSLSEGARRVPYEVLIPKRPPSERAECYYKRRRAPTGVGIGVVYRGDAGEILLSLHESARWERWLEGATWTGTEVEGIHIDVVDPTTQATEPWTTGWYARRQIGRTCVVAGPVADRVMLLDAIVEMEPIAPTAGSLADRPEVAYDLGIEAQQLGETQIALAAFREAGESGHPRFTARGWYRAAHLLEAGGDLPAAEDAYRHATEGDPRESAAAKAAVNLGALLHRRGETAAGQEQWRRVREMDDPVQASLATINLGAVEFAADNLDAAEALFTQAASARIPGRSAQAAVFLGLTHERRGDLDTARRVLAIAAEDPDQEWAARAKTELDRLTPQETRPAPPGTT